MSPGLHSGIADSFRSAGGEIRAEAAVTIKLPAAVWLSPTVNGMAAVAVFWLVVWSAMLEMVGAVFAVALTVNTATPLTVAPQLLVNTARKRLPSSAGVVVNV